MWWGWSGVQRERMRVKAREKERECKLVGKVRKIFLDEKTCELCLD